MPLLTRALPTVAIAAGCLLLGSTGGAIAGSMVTGAQIKNGTITSVDVKNGGLNEADLSPSAVKALSGQTGPAGATGQTGATGPAGAPGSPGAPGTSGFAQQQEVYQSMEVPAGQIGSSFRTCPNQMYVLSATGLWESGYGIGVDNAPIDITTSAHGAGATSRNIKNYADDLNVYLTCVPG